MDSTKQELVICIVNSGFSTDVIHAARKAGCKGGTVIHANGTANPESEQFFGILIEPKKEMVLMVVPAEIRNAVLSKVNDAVGMDTNGKGIAFALPVEKAVGITL